MRYTDYWLLLLMLTVFGAQALTETTSLSNIDIEGIGITGQTFFNMRPGSSDTARKLVGVDNLWNLTVPECGWWSIASLSIGYQRTNAGSTIGQYLAFGFGVTTFSSDSVTPYFEGTADEVIVNTSSNVRATDFALSASFKSTIEFVPVISQWIQDFDVLMGLDGCWSGLYLRVNVPLIYAKYNLRADEDISIKDVSAYPAGFITNTSSDFSPGYSSADNAWQQLGPLGDIEESTCGKLPLCSQTSFGVGAVNLEVGRNFIDCCALTIGIGLYGTFGTANSPHATYLFPAVAGTYNNQLGVSGHFAWNLWSCCDQFITLYNQTVLTHLFGDSQERILGLGLGDASTDQRSLGGDSWVLLKTFDGSGVYTGKTVRAVDMLCRNITVSNSVMLDTSFMLNWRYCNFDLGIGWNYWYRSADHADACVVRAKGGFDGGDYGIKGVAPSGNGSGTINSTYYAKQDSNIHASGTLLNGTDSSGFVTEHDVVVATALAPDGHTNKLFGYFDHRWEGCANEPYLGLYGFYEWGEANKTASQWGLYFKGGFMMDDYLEYICP